MCFFLQAIDSIHNVGVFCLALVPANTLPKTPLGGIHLSETKQLFLEGSLHPCNVLMCPHTCVTNLPKPRQKQPGLSAARSPQMSYEIRSARNCVCVCCRLLVCDVLPLLGPAEIGPASVMVGNLVSGKRIAQASGRDLGQIEDNDQARKVCVWYHGASIFICHSMHSPSLSFIPHLQQTIQSHPAKNMHRNWHIFVFNASVAIH